MGPAASNISESVDSLAYGDLVKNITNEKVSADADMEEQLRFLQVQRQSFSHTHSHIHTHTYAHTQACILTYPPADGDRGSL